MQWLEPSLLLKKTVLSVGCAVKTDLSSVPEKKTEETNQPTNQQPTLTLLVGQQPDQCAVVAVTLAPIPKQTGLNKFPFIALFWLIFRLFWRKTQYKILFILILIPSNILLIPLGQCVLNTLYNLQTKSLVS